MRTNYAGFALTLGMGLMVLLLGFAALSAAGLVQLVPTTEVAAAPADSTAAALQQFGEYGPGPRPVSSLAPFDTTAGAASGGDAATMALGDALFKNNCAQCHAVNEKVVGPALAGITKRRPVSWLILWVHNSSKVVAADDEYAVKLYDEYGKQQMPSFPQLSDKDIKAIMTYVSLSEGSVAYAPTMAVAK